MKEIPPPRRSALERAAPPPPRRSDLRTATALARAVQVVAKYQGYLRSHPELIEAAQRELEGQAPRSRGVPPVGLSEPEVWLDTGEAARHLRISSSSLTKWRCTGRGPPFCKAGFSVRYSLRDLDAWLAARRVTSTSAMAAPATRRQSLET
jgi:hypothetical protein